MIRCCFRFLLLLITVSVLFYVEDSMIYENYEITKNSVSKHCLIPNVIFPRKSEIEENRITLVLHASADKINISIKR